MADSSEPSPDDPPLPDEPLDANAWDEEGSAKAFESRDEAYLGDYINYTPEPIEADDASSQNEDSESKPKIPLYKEVDQVIRDLREGKLASTSPSPDPGHMLEITVALRKQHYCDIAIVCSLRITAAIGSTAALLITTMQGNFSLYSSGVSVIYISLSTNAAYATNITALRQRCFQSQRVSYPQPYTSPSLDPPIGAALTLMPAPGGQALHESPMPSWSLADEPYVALCPCHCTCHV